MPQRAADEQEHRRGLVLGLTLAEVLLLLLFVLLLALAWRMQTLQRQVAADKQVIHRLQDETRKLEATLVSLSPLLEKLRTSGGLDQVTVQQLIEKIGRADVLESEVAELRKSIGELKTRLAVAQAASGEKAKIVEAALMSASKIDPNDPPAVLIRALQILKRLGSETQPDQVKSLTEMSADATLHEQLALLTTESEKYRRQVENMRGNGRTFPSCWMTAQNKTEYMFDVVIYDTGLMVKDATPSRASDPAWEMMQPFARNDVIKENIFQNATARLFEWSKQEQCRFYAIIRDATGESSKRRYKQLRGLVESHFYPLLLPLQPTQTLSRPRQTPHEPQQSGVGGPLVPLPLTR